MDKIIETQLPKSRRKNQELRDRFVEGFKHGLFSMGAPSPTSSGALFEAIVCFQTSIFTMAESILKWVDEEACKDAIRAVRKEEVEWYVRNHFRHAFTKRLYTKIHEFHAPTKR